MSDSFTFDTERAVVGLSRGRQQADLLALACGPAFASLLDMVSRSVSVTHMGIRGQTVTGGRVVQEDASTFTFGRYLSDIDKSLGALNLEQTSLFGYSHAGYFATSYAVQNPDRVQALVLAEPALFTDANDLRKRAALALGDQGVESVVAMIDYVSGELGDDQSRQYAEQIRKGWQSDGAMAAEWLVRADNPISEAQLRSLTMPVLLIGGTKSKVGFMVEKAASLIPRANVWWVKGADHFSLMSRRFAQPLGSVIESFLEDAAR